MIFWKPLVCHCVKYDNSFFHSVCNEKKMAFLDYVLNYVSSVLMQSEDIWNFHSSLTLNKWKLAGILWCVRYDSFFHSVRNERKNGLF